MLIVPSLVNGFTNNAQKRNIFNIFLSSLCRRSLMIFLMQKRRKLNFKFSTSLNAFRNENVSHFIMHPNGSISKMESVKDVRPHFKHILPRFFRD